MKSICLIAAMLFIPFFYSKAQKPNAKYYLIRGGDCMNVVPGTMTEKRKKQCISEFSKAIDLDPKLWQAYRGRARAYYDIKEYKKALSDLNLALSLTDWNSNFDLLFVKGQCHYELGQYKIAIECFNRVLKVAGNPDATYLNRAKAKWKLGLKKQACIDFNKAISRSPSYKKEAEFIICN